MAMQPLSSTQRTALRRLLSPEQMACIVDALHCAGEVHRHTVKIQGLSDTAVAAAAAKAADAAILLDDLE